MSGGLDSTVLLHRTVAFSDLEVYGLSFDYGQRHRKELEFARYWGQKLCVDWKLLNISFMSQIADKSSLTGDLKMPHTHYSHESQKVTVVPNRNMVMLAIAVAWAENLEAPIVFYGAHLNDRSVYPDCKPEFVEAVSLAATKGTLTKVRVEAPFVDKYKADLVALGIQLGVDFSNTWSCYEGQKRPCLECATCLERTEAFTKNNCQDPLLTNEEWLHALEKLERSEKDVT